MKVMVLVKASKNSEAGVMPSEQLLRDMGKFNEELVKAGVLLAAEGLQPSSRGKRVRFSGAKRTVIDGPFAETKELLAGYWIWKVKSMDEAVEWLKRCPTPTPKRARSRFARCSIPRTSLVPTPQASSGPPKRACGHRAKGKVRRRTVTIPTFVPQKGDAMKVQPYLNFDGRCEEALGFYRQALGAEVLMLMRFKDSPEPCDPGMVPPGAENKVMHASFRIGDTTLMASDGRCGGHASFQGTSLSITVPDLALRRTVVRCSRRWRPGPDAVDQDLLLARFRTGGRPLRRAMADPRGA